MTKPIKAVFAFLLCISLFVSLSVTSFADEMSSDRAKSGNVATEYYTDDLTEEYAVETATIPMSSPPSIDAKSVILMEQSTGKILYENNANEKLPPASITKIMTMLLVSEALDDTRLKLSDIVTTSEHAASMGGSQIWLEPKETMTVEELLKAVAVGSANDASVALAEHIAGSEEGFVGMMNEKAQSLKMNNTIFKNACGLDDEGHISSAKDVAIMSRELLKHDVIRKFTSIWMDSLRGGDTQLVNTNKLVRFYMGATGLKTGTTSKAGFCLSASAKRDNMELIAVVMDAKSSNDRFSGAKKLLDYGFANWKIMKPVFDKSQINKIEVKMGQKGSVNIKVDKPANELIKSNDKSKITTKIDIPESIEAPVAKGQKIGTLTVLNGNSKLSEYSIYATDDVKRTDFGFALMNLMKSWMTP